MAQRHLDPTAGPVPADALAGYLRDRATEFLRALRLHRETGAGAAGSEGSVEAARALRRAARRISAGLHTFQPVLDPDWAEALRPELAWVSGTLAQEHAYAARLDRLLLALHRLSGATPFPTQAASGPSGTASTPRSGGSSGTGARNGPNGTTAHSGGSPADLPLGTETRRASANTPHSTATPAATGTRPGADGAPGARGGGSPGVTGRNAAADGTIAQTPGARPPTGTGDTPGRTAPTHDGPHAPTDTQSTTPATPRTTTPPNAPTGTDGTPGRTAPMRDGVLPATDTQGTPPAGPSGAAAHVGPRAPGRAAVAVRDRAGRAVAAADGAGDAALRVTAATAPAAPRGDGGRPARSVPAPGRAGLTVGAAKAGALLDRQLTLARTRAHSTALQALGSSRFHGIADKVAVLASEVPLSPAAADADLRPLADAARERLADAVAALPLLTAGSPYNAEALIHGLSPDPAPHPQDAPWHQVRLLLRLHRYAREVLHAGAAPSADLRLLAAGEALDRHRDASEAAAAAAQAARTPRIAPATAYALGVLHADQRHEVEAARYAFQRAWQKEAIGMS
ncbi:hypothetical protein GCM10010297_58420 [Streptomyces malachitofuscus]|nr:hypothetical protein GCM10010297_58420 [Streptomyces malachitofuscus]